MLERITPPSGALIDDCAIPGGTIVGVNACLVNHNTDIFGADAATFRPERWLEAPEKVGNMKRMLFSVYNPYKSP